MPVGAAHIHNSKIGTCPHGMPMGACPICSGMAGGNSTTKRDTPRNVGEMTYNQCAAIGAMLKAQKAARQRAEVNQQSFIQSMVQFQKTLEGVHQRIIDLAANISKSVPAIISTPANFVLTQIVARVINIMAGIPNAMANFAQKFVDIADKLAAVYGELKASVSKSLSNLWGIIKLNFSISHDSAASIAPEAPSVCPVSDFVEAHNGTLTVESELGKGSKFIVTLPV